MQTLKHTSTHNKWEKRSNMVIHGDAAHGKVNQISNKDT